MRTVLRKRRGGLKAARDAPGSQESPAAVCLVRQPVFDTDEAIVGHRVLSRAGATGPTGGYVSTLPQGEDAELALAEELHSVAPRGRVLLSVSPAELLEQRTISLPGDRVVLCLGADARLDDALRDVIDRHAMRGLALGLERVDLATVNSPLLDLAQTVMVDVGAHSQGQLEDLLASLRQRVRQRELIACGVDSRAALQNCWRLGFDGFQGQFFLRPTPGPASTVANSGLSGIGTMADLAATDSFERLAAIITQDPGLSMRLLRYANSANSALPRRVGSVHEALAWLGTVAVREFALVAALAEVRAASPEMLVTALTRARMCQLLSARLPATNPEESFTVGLFSIAEAVTNAPMSAVIAELPLRDDVASALLRGDGELGRLLAGVVAYERGDFASAAQAAGAPRALAEAYLESLRWADSAVRAVC